MELKNRHFQCLQTQFWLFFATLVITNHSHAVDQQWLSLQADHQLPDQQKISFNFQRRDQADLYSKKLLNVYRLYYRFQQEEWQFTLGFAYFDLENGSNERRLHQFAGRSIELFDKKIVSSTVRLGLEQRHFNSDNSIYLRLRARLLFHLFPQKSFGPSLYHESFYIPNGQDRFVSTLSENRTGIGARYKLPNVNFLLFHTYTFLKLPNKIKYQQWWQFSINFLF